MPQLSIIANQQVPFHIVYQDEHLLVIDKPAGVVTQPGIKHQKDSLLNGLFAHFGTTLQNLGKKRDFGLLHRLDRGTAGLLIVGLSNQAYDLLRDDFKHRKINKEYLCLVKGIMKGKKGKCTWPILEKKIQGKKRAIVIKKYSSSTSFDQAKAEKAITYYKSISCTPKPTQISQSQVPASLIHCKIETGKLHQIRVHMNALGHPILGDFEYAGKSPLNLLYRSIDRGNLALIAYQLSFIHPITREHLQLTAKVPKAFLQTLQTLHIKHEQIQQNQVAKL